MKTENIISHNKYAKKSGIIHFQVVQFEPCTNSHFEKYLNSLLPIHKVFFHTGNGKSFTMFAQKSFSIVLSTYQQVFERVIFKRIYNYILDNKLLYKFQSGYVPGNSLLYSYYTGPYPLCNGYAQYLNTPGFFPRIVQVDVLGE